ncbi:hypothetical protein L3X37_07000 [Sabulilitoribacter arenilitoris]|uniref:Uncharacterized protein n=1 Tax=Wocania arenilitoris TaxID=2044858 RepID=A0AAE3EQB3_9FLAO|nr:hypothetical protein [Wocania arenilitoris]MCF7568110.1 hypothetical protein [Wocania arenilitoris]
MKTNYLLPNKYKIVGWVLFILGIISGLLITIYEFELDFFKIKVLQMFNFKGNKEPFFCIIKNNVLDEIISICIIVGGLLVGFTKEKIEDEFIYKLRKDSLVWAIICNYTILLFTIIFIYGGDFFDIMIYNMFTPLLFFIIRFNFLKLKNRSHEE